MRNIFFFFISLLITTNSFCEDGYQLWMRYNLIDNQKRLQEYTTSLTNAAVYGNSPTIQALKDELSVSFKGLLNNNLNFTGNIKTNGTLIIGTPSASPPISSLKIDELKKTGTEGYIIKNITIENKKCIVISSNSDIGLLYGTYHLIRLLQTQQSIENLNIINSPKIELRLLNHWDNLNRTVERGYAGTSLWNWNVLPEYISPRYIDYARANASVGINGTVLTNVNANAQVLTEDYLKKVAVLADVFRPYGIKIYLTARFSAPVEIGGLKTADPLDKEVEAWWQKKVDEIYTWIPDFGGFLVKANSEGQPGPQNYGRNHAEGANMLAKTLAPKGGIVMWRAFVYDNNVPDDRAKQAYNEFKPLDGKFLDNVLVQVKNGAIDFQPREPFHPMFGSMPSTQLMMEFQITQEYLGQNTHLVYLAPLFKECLDSDTYAKGEGSTVAKVIDGSIDNHKITAIAGVSNIGSDRNWCGHPFAQSNWYAFGRLAWDYTLSSNQIAEEWVRMTFTNNESFISPIVSMMLNSRENTVNYMTPLGLHHIMGYNHHYGPSPWVNKGRADWTSVYYHRADSIGIGFNRSSTGSDAVSQYHLPVKLIYDNKESCPENLLLWFHHVDWDYKMKSGKTLWEELCYKYHEGVDSVRRMQELWKTFEKQIDQERYSHVKALLDIQEKESVVWRDACLLYFQTFSKRPFPEKLEKPAFKLEHYKNMINQYIPSI